MLGDQPRRATCGDRREASSGRPPEEAPAEGATTPAEQPGVMLAQSLERWSLRDARSSLRRWRQRIGQGLPAA